MVCVAVTVRWFESRSPLKFEPCIAGLDRWQDHTEIFDAWERAIPGVEVGIGFTTDRGSRKAMW